MNETLPVKNNLLHFLIVNLHDEDNLGVKITDRRRKRFKP